MSAKIAPTGSNLIVDILYSTTSGGSWNSIFVSGSSNKLVLPAGARVATANGFSIPNLGRNTLLRVDYIQVGSGVAGGGLLITINGRINR